MRRLCVMFHQDSTTILSKEDLERRFRRASVEVKGRTLDRYLIYFRDKEIIEFLEDNEGNKGYRCCDTRKALAYIEGRFEEYAGQVAPRRPPIRPEGTVRHRPAQKIILHGGEFEKAKAVGIWRKTGKPPGYYHVVTDGFNMKVWTSGRAHVFLTGDWKAGIAKVFGPTVVQKVEYEINQGNGHEGVAVPQKGRLPKKWLDNLPVKSVASIFSDSGQITTLRYGYSQVPEGELDRHGPVNEPNANQVESWLEDELKFKVDVRNLFTTQNAKLERLIELQEGLPEAIGEAVKKGIREFMKEQERPKGEGEYRPGVQEPDDYSYR